MSAGPPPTALALTPAEPTERTTPPIDAATASASPH